MTNSKNTKRALLASVLSVVLCCAMLVGSTFAWFTDSVTSGKNRIVAGNLDVELYNVKDGKETPVTAETNLFLEDALWEPGHVEVINLKVANLGTLALQYKFGVNVAAENEGTNVAGDTFKLSDYIKFALIDGNNTYATREEAVAAADANAVALSALAVDENGVLYPDGKGISERYVTLVVYMPTTVGNEANYLTGTKAPTIDLGVTLVATQTPYESDSFDENYDEDAPALSYEVNPDNIQEYLNGEHGSMSDVKLILAPGNYGQLVIGNPAKYAESDTVYTCMDGNDHSNTPVSFTDAEAFKAHMENGWHYTPYYTRTIDNLTLVGQEGVNVAGLSIASGHVYGDNVLDPVRETTANGSRYYLTQKLSNITFENITFTARVNIETSNVNTVIDGVTFDSCSFNINNISAGNQGLRYYNEANNGNVKNLTVKDCSFTNCYQGVFTSHIAGVSVTDCTFDTTGHNAIQLTGQSPVSHKAVVITGNTFANIGDRIIRFNDVGADTQLTIKNNTATNSGDSDGQVIKATSLAVGITYDISNNNWGEGKTIANDELKDIVY